MPEADELLPKAMAKISEEVAPKPNAMPPVLAAVETEPIAIAPDPCVPSIEPPVTSELFEFDFAPEPIVMLKSFVSPVEAIDGALPETPTITFGTDCAKATEETLAINAEIKAVRDINLFMDQTLLVL